MIITIDGPAGAGKSTVAQQLAGKLGFDYLDTGAMYRAVTWKALRKNIDLSDTSRLSILAKKADIELENLDDTQKVYCEGTDVTEEIRSSEVTNNIHYLADEPEVRKALISLQRQYASDRDVVTEGRDQGSEVFPNAEIKFYLDASIETRAKRRLKDLQHGTESPSFQKVLEDIQTRDEHDRSREMGGLRLEDDMMVIDSTNLSIEEVVNKMYAIICGRTSAQILTGQANA